MAALGIDVIVATVRSVASMPPAVTGFAHEHQPERVRTGVPGDRPRFWLGSLIWLCETTAPWPANRLETAADEGRTSGHAEPRRLTTSEPGGGWPRPRSHLRRLHLDGEVRSVTACVRKQQRPAPEAVARSWPLIDPSTTLGAYWQERRIVPQGRPRSPHTGAVGEAGADRSGPLSAPASPDRAGSRLPGATDPRPPGFPIEPTAGR